MNNDKMMAIVNDFVNCENHSCDNCRCKEILNSTGLHVCDLLVAYRKDMHKRITEWLDKMY